MPMPSERCGLAFLLVSAEAEQAVPLRTAHLAVSLSKRGRREEAELVQRVKVSRRLQQCGRRKMHSFRSFALSLQLEMWLFKGEKIFLAAPRDKHLF